MFNCLFTYLSICLPICLSICLCGDIFKDYHLSTCSPTKIIRSSFVYPALLIICPICLHACLFRNVLILFVCLLAERSGVSVCLVLFICLSTYLPTCLSACLSVCYLSAICLPICLSICHLSACAKISPRTTYHLSACLFAETTRSSIPYFALLIISPVCLRVCLYKDILIVFCLFCFICLLICLCEHISNNYHLFACLFAETIRLSLAYRVLLTICPVCSVFVFIKIFWLSLACLPCLPVNLPLRRYLEGLSSICLFTCRDNSTILVYFALLTIYLNYLRAYLCKLILTLFACLLAEMSRFSVCPTLFVCLPACYQSACLPACLSVFMPAYLPLPRYLQGWPATCLFSSRDNSTISCLPCFADHRPRLPACLPLQRYLIVSCLPCLHYGSPITIMDSNCE